MLDNRKTLKAVIGALHTPTGDMITRTKHEDAKMHFTFTHKKAHSKFQRSHPSMLDEQTPLNRPTSNDLRPRGMLDYSVLGPAELKWDRNPRPV
jgi:hypothetical protein